MVWTGKAKQKRDTIATASKPGLVIATTCKYERARRESSCRNWPVLLAIREELWLSAKQSCHCIMWTVRGVLENKYSSLSLNPTYTLLLMPSIG